MDEVESPTEGDLGTVFVMLKRSSRIIPEILQISGNFFNAAGERKVER